MKQTAHTKEKQPKTTSCPERMSKPDHLFIGGPVYRAYSSVRPVCSRQRRMRLKVDTLHRFADELSRPEGGRGGIVTCSEAGDGPIGIILNAWVENDNVFYVSAKLFSGGPGMDAIFARLLSGDISRFGISVDIIINHPELPEQFIAVDIGTYSQSEEGRIVHVDRDYEYMQRGG